VVRLGYAKRTARAMLRDPRHAAEDAWEDLCRVRERPAPTVQGISSPEWEGQLHELLGASWPCADSAAFEAVWRDIQATLQEGGLSSGRGAYGGWDDGDSGLARAVWCITSHLRAQRVVETGVARGITTRTILDALQRSGDGELWSIDLPPLHRVDLDVEIGFVVPSERRDRWTLIEGSSRRRLPGLLERLGSIDLFVHDSLHSERNIRFELERAWPFLREGGAVVVDDVHKNAGFYAWLERTPDARSIICRSDDRSALFAVAVKRSQLTRDRSGA
jgi:Methyltransferase domain